jgi:hypothetical protein
MMPRLIGNEEYWCEFAKDARAMADNLSNDECNRIMHEIAECYEHLAALSRLFHEATGKGFPAAIVVLSKT